MGFALKLKKCGFIFLHLPIHLLNFHGYNYTKGEAVALWAEPIKDICYHYLSWLFKVGMILNVRLISLEYDNISTGIEIYTYLRSLVLFPQIFSSFLPKKNLICTESFFGTLYVSWYFTSLIMSPLHFFRVHYSLDFLPLGPFSVFKRTSYLALSCIVLCVSLGLLYCMGFLLDITSESISQIKSTCLFIFCLTPLK